MSRRSVRYFTVYAGLSRVEEGIHAEGFGISFLEALHQECRVLPAILVASARPCGTARAELWFLRPMWSGRERASHLPEHEAKRAVWARRGGCSRDLLQLGSCRARYARVHTRRHFLAIAMTLRDVSIARDQTSFRISSFSAATSLFRWRRRRFSS